MVPGFTGSTEIDLPVPFSYDLEIGSTRYFAGLDGGEVPLLLLFSGTLFGSADGRLAVQQVPWSKEAPYRLPVSIWREAIDAHFPDSAWIKMSRGHARRAAPLQVPPGAAHLGRDDRRCSRSRRGADDRGGGAES